MMTRSCQRWIALLAVPVLMASTLVACQRSGEDMGKGASSGTSGGGTSQSGAERSSRSNRSESKTGESSGEKSSSR